MISVIIPIRNRAELFAETVQSLIAQTLVAWEAVVVDDGSSTAEFSRITAIVARDPRFRLLRNPGPRSGACAARNAGMAAARAELLVFLDADDLLAPTCLKRRFAVMSERHELDFAVFQTRVFHEVPGDSEAWWNRFTDENDLDRLIRTDVPWQTAGAIWRRSAVAQRGGWDERARNWQDWEFHIRMVAAGLSYEKFPETDSYWRAATELGSISTAAHSPAGILNRTRTFLRTAALLEKRRVLTPYRRRIFSTLFFQDAFQRPHLRRAHIFLIWYLGWRGGLVSTFDFTGVLFAEFVARAAKNFEVKRFPNVLWRSRTTPDN